jgi:hypothetical protein
MTGGTVGTNPGGDEGGVGVGEGSGRNGAKGFGGVVVVDGVVSVVSVSVSDGVVVGVVVGAVVVVVRRGVVVCGYSRTDVRGTQVYSGSGTKPGGTTCVTSGVGAGGGL